MSNVNTNIVWTELRANILNIPIDSDVICTICKQIMMDSRCAPCGCRYCFVCISTYLNGQNKTCPGQTINCKSEVIILNGNTFNDHGINRKISRMIVKCPINYCKFKDEVRNIENHMQSCNLKPTNCPFSNIGCQQTNIAKENMNKHCKDELMQHSKLLLDDYQNMTTKMESILDKLEKIEIGNKALKEENEVLNQDKNANQLALWEIEANANDNRNKINGIENNINDSHNTIKEMQKEIKQLKSQVKIFNDPDIKTISVKDWINMITPLHKEMDKRFQETKEEIDEIKNDMKEIKKDIEKLNTNLTNNVQRSNSSDFLDEKKVKSINEKNLKKHKICKRFYWEINNFFTKVNKTLLDTKKFCSESFYTHENGYNMCLELNGNAYSSGKGTPIYISYCLMEGDYDDHLLWPCKFDVQFDLINPYNNKLYSSCYINNDFYPSHPGKLKPGLERCPVGCRMVKLEDILNIKDWRRKDQIIVECTISFDDY